jgi:MFS family permease
MSHIRAEGAPAHRTPAHRTDAHRTQDPHTQDPRTDGTLVNASPPPQAPDRRAGGDPQDAAKTGFGGKLMTPLLMGALLNPVNSTMIATTLVAIGHSFGVGAADTAWLVASLYLASAVGQPTMGRLADLLGPRRVFVAGLVVVILAGLIGALAPAFGWLVASRILLGVGTSAAYPCAMAILRRRSRALGVPTPRPVLGRLSLAALGSAAMGPVLGGLLAGSVGWRGIFAVNVPVALLGLVLALLWLPKDPVDAGSRKEHAASQRRSLSALSWSSVAHRPTGVPTLDPLGIVLFAASLSTAMIFLMDLSSPQWLLLLPFAVLGGAFVRWQLHHPNPFLDLRMLGRHRPLVRTYIRQGLAYLVIYSVMYGFAQWLEESHGFSSFHSGLIMLPMSVAAAVCSLIGARTKGIRGPLMLAAVLLIGGGAVLVLAHGSTPLIALLSASVLFGLPQGLTATSNQAAVAAQAPADGMGAAAGLQRTSQYIGAITASSLIGLFYGQRANDSGLHEIAVLSAALGVVLLALTIVDRSLRGRS